MEWKLVKKEFNVMKNLEGKYYIGVSIAINVFHLIDNC